MDDIDFILDDSTSFAPRTGGEPAKDPIRHDGYCTCTAQLVFTDNGFEGSWQCPVDGNRFEPTGASTLLYSETTVQASHLFDRLIRSSAHDPTNMKIAHECPKCLRKLMTFLMLGQQEKPFLTCKCGHVLAIDNNAPGTE